jgi:hypothetical protein
LIYTTTALIDLYAFFSIKQGVMFKLAPF